ncbi:MAG: hypothetical protein HY901_09170 [Deltaproteobacteria bacterium]|nr:hypothetical protein [Deltaproteobacteria bacterium]
MRAYQAIGALAGCALLVASGCGSEGLSIGLAGLLALLLWSCGSSKPSASSEDATTSAGQDAAQPAPGLDASAGADASTPETDASTPVADAASSAADASTPVADAASPAADASTPGLDAGTSPDTVLENHPLALTGERSATFAFSSPTPGASFECKLDQASFAACTSPTTYPNLAEGAHAFAVRAVDEQQQVDPSPATFAWSIDLTPPTAGQVVDGLGSDLTFQRDPANLAAHWLGFTDAAAYRYNASLGADCLGEVVAAIDVGPATSYTATASLVSGTSYRSCVQGVDDAGNQSAWVASNGVTVDAVPPASTITSPVSGAFLQAAPALEGVASDDLSGVSKVEVSVGREADQTFWTGSTWAAGETWVATTGQEAWSLPSVVFDQDGLYTVHSQATDGAGNLQSPRAQASFTLDRQAPTFAGIAAATLSGPDSATLTWSAASDQLCAAQSIVYDVCQANVAGECLASPFAVLSTTAPGALEVEIAGLAEGTTAYFVVRARDLAGNRDDNQVEATVEVPVPAHLAYELQYGVPGSYVLAQSSTNPDEFLRTTDLVDLRIPAWMLWETLHPSEPIPADARLQQLVAVVDYVNQGVQGPLAPASRAISRWEDTSFAMVAVISSVWIPTAEWALDLSLTITDLADPAVSVTIDASQIADTAVFGGDPMVRTILLDTQGSTKRERVIERGPILQGAQVRLAYSDWRLDLLVDKANLNTQIGTAMFHGRFGQYVAPIFGKLRYEVYAGISLDGGGTFNPEQELVAVSNGRILQSERTSYEGTVDLPAIANQLLFYGHVKAILVADYTPYSNVNQRWYSDGQESVIREAWDNPSGANTNYVFPVVPK